MNVLQRLYESATQSRRYERPPKGDLSRCDYGYMDQIQ